MPTACGCGDAQIVGGIAGALLEAALVPGLTWAWFGHHNKEAAPGCFYPGAVNSWELFLWELILTFVLVRRWISRLPSICWQPAASVLLSLPALPCGHYSCFESQHSLLSVQNYIRGPAFIPWCVVSTCRCMWCMPSRLLSQATATLAPSSWGSPSSLLSRPVSLDPRRQCSSQAKGSIDLHQLYLHSLIQLAGACLNIHARATALMRFMRQNLPHPLISDHEAQAHASPAPA